MFLLHFRRLNSALENKIREIVSGLVKDYRSNRIRTATELTYRVYNCLKELIDGYNKPSMKKRYAWGPPVSKDYNSTIDEIKNDLTSLYSRCQEIDKQMVNYFNQTENIKQRINNRLKELEISLGKLKEDINIRYDEVIYRETFTSYNNYDVDAVSTTMAEINPMATALTLSRTSASEFRTDASITILPLSNGIPGNTHQVKSKKEVKFYGEENLRINLADIIDGNRNTWFEYEVYNIPDEVLSATGNFGYNYQEGVYWADNRIKRLYLGLKISFKTPKQINWISINPYLPGNKKYKPAVVEKMTVRYEKTENNKTVTYINKTVKASKILNDEVVFQLNETTMKVKEIEIVFRQDTPYETLVGHFYYTKKVAAGLRVMKLSGIDKTVYDEIRVAGPVPSIKYLGLSYDQNKQKIVYPVVKYGDTIKNIQEIKQNLFYPLKASDTSITSRGPEAILAWRYMIGIRDITTACNTYAPYSLYISRDFTTKTPIREIMLNAIEQIPEEFKCGDNWIRYEISIDGGITWHRIYPAHKQKAGYITKYYINYYVPEGGRDTRYYGYLDSINPVYSVKLRIHLERPTQPSWMQYLTPILHEYTLILKTEEAT